MTPTWTAVPILLALAVLAPSCESAYERKAHEDAALLPPAIDAVRDSITAQGLLQHIRVLSSDRFEGRKPGSAGEELTVEYLTDALQSMGLEPGNPDGTYVQEVPLAGYTSHAEVSVEVGGRALELAPEEDVVCVSRRLVPEVRVDRSDLVFVGYGIVAPEYGWDDFKDADLHGKTLVVLVNDPPIPDPEHPDQLDPKMFRGRAMTYYGRWTYKYEVATEKGAAAVLIVHETGPAGYPWDVVRSGWTGEAFDLDAPDGNAGRVAVEGWLSSPAAERLFAAAGTDLATLKAEALSRDFRPVPLDGRASFHVTNDVRRLRSRNVIALLRGSDPDVQDQFVVYTAHWDHLGRDETLEGDQIYNGALDNASGTAGVLELAHAFARFPTRPRRSILFLLVTAEEQGLLGSKHYAAHPLYPLEETLADINIDGLNVWGRTRDIAVVGAGSSTLDGLLEAAAVQAGRAVVPESEPEKGYYYRSDHFEFAKRGVPALYVDPGTDAIGRPAGWAKERQDEYLQQRYHQVTDEIQPDWDLTGAVEDLWLLFRVGLSVANGSSWPEWKPGSEFKATRDAMLEKAAG
jgi:Zn-dependent M28 family amino/carboxypeptidase